MLVPYADYNVAPRQPIAATLAPPLGDQLALLDQQCQAALQRPGRKFEGQPVTNGANLHTGWMTFRNR